MTIDRYKFSDVFTENIDGSLTPKLRINVNGVSLDQNVTLKAGVAFGGIDFATYRNLDIAGEYENDILNIKGFFKNA